MSIKTVDQALGGELIAAGGTFPEDEPPSFTASHADPVAPFLKMSLQVSQLHMLSNEVGGHVALATLAFQLL